MADISVTAANVHVYDGARTDIVQVNETVTAGQSVYPGSDGKWRKTEADDAETSAGAVSTSPPAIVLVGAAADGYAVIVRKGPMDVGATLTVGTAYIVSATSGGIAPAADFAGYTGAWQVHLGYASTTSRLEVNPFFTGATIA